MTKSQSLGESIASVQEAVRQGNYRSAKDRAQIAAKILRRISRGLSNSFTRMGQDFDQASFERRGLARRIDGNFARVGQDFDEAKVERKDIKDRIDAGNIILTQETQTQLGKMNGILK